MSVALQDEVHETGLVATTRAADASAHGFWLHVRAALPIEGFRALVGVLLAVHFMRGASELAPLLERGFLPDALAHSALATLPAWTARALFVGCSVLALCGALGVAVRLCAALLLIANALLGQVLFQLHHLDDWLASVSCFWLLVLPVGRSWLTRRAGAKPTRGARVSGVVVSMLLVHVLAFYLNVRLWGVFSPLWQPNQPVTIAACLVPGLYLAPFVVARRAAAVLQLGLHGYLACVMGEPLTQGLLMATSLLFWGEHAPRLHLPEARPWFDLAAAAAACYSLTLLLWSASLLVGPNDLTFTTGRVLEDLGLHPPLLPQQARKVALAFVATDGKARAWQAVRGLPDASHLATRLLTTQIVSAALSSSEGARELALSELRPISLAYCDGRIPSERLVTITLHAPELDAGRPVSIASFHCYDPEDSLRLRVAPARSLTDVASPREKAHAHPTP